MFKYRDHRGSLSESMKTVQEFRDKEGLLLFLKENYNCSVVLSMETLNISFYCRDTRMDGWKNTHAVSITGFGVVGFTDGPA